MDGAIANLKNLSKTIGVAGGLRREQILEVLDREGLALVREKYGFRNIITRYLQRTDEFCVLQAPVAYAFSDWETYLHLGHLGFLTESRKKASEMEWFGSEVVAIPKFWRWFLRVFKTV